MSCERTKFIASVFFLWLCFVEFRNERNEKKKEKTNKQTNKQTKNKNSKENQHLVNERK